MEKTFVEQLLERNLRQPEKTSAILYHGSEHEFDVFVYVGKRATALDYGHYLTPSLDKALLYGPVVMRFEYKANILDWDRLDSLERQAIEQLLLDRVPQDRLAGFALRSSKTFQPSEKKEAHEFYKQKKAETAHYWHDRAKARVDLDGNNFVITWSEGRTLDGANNHQLLALAQEYFHDIARYLGFEGAKFGDEVAIYDASLLRKIETLTLSDVNAQINLSQSLSNFRPMFHK